LHNWSNTQYTDDELMNQLSKKMLSINLHNILLRNMQKVTISCVHSYIIY